MVASTRHALNQIQIHRTRPASHQIQIHIALGPPSTKFKDHIIIMAPLMELHIDFAIVVESNQPNNPYLLLPVVFCGCFVIILSICNKMLTLYSLYVWSLSLLISSWRLSNQTYDHYLCPLCLLYAIAYLVILFACYSSEPI